MSGMSGRSGASESVRSAAGSVRLGPASGAGHEFVLDALYERKRDNKSMRVLTVLIYVFCVSLAAIMLSLYYVFFWEPKDAHYAQRKVAHTVDQQTPMPTCLMPHTGGGNTTVSDAESYSPDNVTGLPTSATIATLNTTSPVNLTSGTLNLTSRFDNKTTMNVDHDALIELDNT